MANFGNKSNEMDADELMKRILLRRALLAKEKFASQNIKPYHEWLFDAAPQYNWNFPHSKYIARYLERLTNQEFRNLMIFLPPRHGKSLTTTVNYPAYRFEVNPKSNILVTSYNSDLAETFSKQTRQIVRDRGIVELDRERQKIDHWLTKGGGNYLGAGVGGGITGRGFDLMIIDDPIRGREEADSQSFRDKQWKWYNDDFKSRRSHSAQQVVILTRWHEDDLAGRLIETNPIGTEFEWMIIRVPAICEGDDPEDFPTQRTMGEALCPDLIPLSMLEDQKVSSPDSFLALYQQRPSAREGDIFKKDWFEHNSPVAKFPNKATKITQVWDTAFEKKQRNDPSAMVEGWMDKDSGLIYVCAMVNEKMEFPELIRAMKQHQERHTATDTCVEDKASGKPARQQLRTQGVPIIEIPTGTIDKEVRARSITSYCESKMVVFVELTGNCNAELRSQLTTFPNGKHDDLVDAFVHLIRRLTGGAQGWSKEDLKALAQSIASAGVDSYS